MLVYADGRTVGTIGGGCYENDAFGRRARPSPRDGPLTVQLRAERRLRAGNRAGLRRADGGLHRAGGGVARGVHLRRRPRRLLRGAGWPTRSASACTSWTTARSSPTPSASGPASTSSSTTSPRGSRPRTLPPTAYAVIVTRGHRHDLDALRALTASPAALPGPHRQQGQGEAHLRRAARGRAARRAPGRIHAPIGLDIGAITPQEIARQHRGRADRRQARQDREGRRSQP